jgi:hypothetical protein
MNDDIHAGQLLAVSLAALAMLTLNAVATAAVFTAGGIAALLVIDYGRPDTPAYVVAEVVALDDRGPDPAASREAA